MYLLQVSSFTRILVAHTPTRLRFVYDLCQGREFQPMGRDYVLRAASQALSPPFKWGSSIIFRSLYSCGYRLLRPVGASKTLAKNYLQFICEELIHRKPVFARPSYERRLGAWSNHLIWAQVMAVIRSAKKKKQKKNESIDVLTGLSTPHILLIVLSPTVRASSARVL